MFKRQFLLGCLVASLPCVGLAQAASVFTDVAVSHPFVQAIRVVKEEGIVTGYSDGTFRPDFPINRAEFTKIVVNTVLSEEQIENCNAITHVDVRVSDWYMHSVCAAVEAGIVGGYADGTFRPSQFINLAEASKIIALTFELPLEGEETTSPWWRPYVNVLSKNRMLPPTFRGADAPLTRAEMAYMIANALPDTESTQETTVELASFVTTGHVYADYADGMQPQEPHILFFYASWCPFCASHDRWLREYYSQHEATISTFRVDFDASQDLRSRYNVTIQDTFVVVDATGAVLETLLVPGMDEIEELLNEAR